MRLALQEDFISDWIEIIDLDRNDKVLYRTTDRADAMARIQEMQQADPPPTEATDA